MKALSVSVILAAFVLGGCSSGGGGNGSNGDGGGGGSGGGSCTPQSTKGACLLSGDAGITTCIAFTGSSFTSSAVQSGCNAVSATMVATCPTTMRLGGCISGCGTSSENIAYFYQGTLYSSASQVMQACTQQNAAFTQ